MVLGRPKPADVNTIQITLKLPADALEIIDKIGKETNVSRGFVIRNILIQNGFLKEGKNAKKTGRVEHSKQKTNVDRRGTDKTKGAL
jgi:hypothetical protein